MTRDEFDAICTYDELKEFCYNEELSDMDNYYDECGINEELDYWITDCDENWRTIRDRLNDVPTGYDFYEYVGGGEVYGYYDGDDNFRALKDDIRSYLEDTGYWDEPDDDDDDDDYTYAQLPPEHVRSPFSHGSVGEATVDFDTTVNILSAIA